MRTNSSQREPKNPTICVECKHHKEIEGLAHPTHWLATTTLVCTAEEERYPTVTNYVTGDVRHMGFNNTDYKLCAVINHGECPHYEKR